MCDGASKVVYAVSSWRFKPLVGTRRLCPKILLDKTGNNTGPRNVFLDSKPGKSDQLTMSNPVYPRVTFIRALSLSAAGGTSRFSPAYRKLTVTLITDVITMRKITNDALANALLVARVVGGKSSGQEGQIRQAGWMEDIDRERTNSEPIRCRKAGMRRAGLGTARPPFLSAPLLQRWRRHAAGG